MPFLWPLTRLESDKKLSRGQVNVLMRRGVGAVEACAMSDDHNEDSLWVSTTTLARELDTTEYVVRRMIHLGELTAYRMGRVIRIRRAEADATIRRAGRD